jgi:hypothetical protein
VVGAAAAVLESTELTEDEIEQAKLAKVLVELSEYSVPSSSKYPRKRSYVWGFIKVATIKDGCDNELESKDKIAHDWFRANKEVFICKICYDKDDTTLHKCLVPARYDTTGRPRTGGKGFRNAKGAAHPGNFQERHLKPCHNIDSKTVGSVQGLPSTFFNPPAKKKKKGGQMTLLDVDQHSDITDSQTQDNMLKFAFITSIPKNSDAQIMEGLYLLEVDYSNDCNIP